MRRLRRIVRALAARLAKYRTRVIQRVAYLSYLIFRLLPARLILAVLTLCELIRLPGRAVLRAGFAPIAASRTLKNPQLRLSSAFTRRFPVSVVRALFGVGAYTECCEYISASGLGLISRAANEIWARAFFELGQFQQANEALDALASKQVLATRPLMAELRGHLKLIAGDEEEGAGLLELAARGSRNMLCPHQNIAARYPRRYTPTQLDELSGLDGRLYDGYNYVGQRVTHVGEGQLCAALYDSALAAQRRLRSAPPQLSAQLKALLTSLDISLEDLRILPVEWYAQVGHQGMLDMLFRMRELGWWRGKVIFLMPDAAVANNAFQRLFEHHGHVLVPGANVDLDVARELFSLQRWCGMAFNAFRLQSGEVVPWQEAGAQMIRRWEALGRGDPLRDEFDRVYGSSKFVKTAVARLREQWGMESDDWYVCLHLRDPSHYGELSGTGQTHRNADVDGYLSMLEYITSRGGWVIKLGGARSPKLPRMKRVFDYARSATKSDLLDLYLIRHARYFVGTTSGLTNVAVSLGTPSALVNCITTDAQLWSSRVRFALKRIQLRDGSYVSQTQITSTPWRWRAFDANVLARHAAIPVGNTQDEILETAKEVEALARDQPECYTREFPDADKLLSRWRSSLAMPHFYGNARPSLYYLKKRESESNRATIPQMAATADSRRVAAKPLAARADSAKASS